MTFFFFLLLLLFVGFVSFLLIYISFVPGKHRHKIKIMNERMNKWVNEHFIRGIRAKFGIPDPPQTLDIGQNSDRGISDFRISH